MSVLSRRWEGRLEFVLGLVCSLVSAFVRINDFLFFLCITDTQLIFFIFTKNNSCACCLPIFSLIYVLDWVQHSQLSRPSQNEQLPHWKQKVWCVETQAIDRPGRLERCRSLRGCPV